MNQALTVVRVVGEYGQQLFPIGRALKLVKCGSKAANSTNLISIGAALHFANEIYDNC